MLSATSLQRLFGIKAGEARTVGLFSLHNFLLGIGSVLVYVAANVLLLEHDPAQSLPLGYVAGALAMMAVGKIYTHFEHHLLLRKLAVRVLLAVVALAAVLGVLVYVGHSVAAAVAIMAGYRVIYLLTNLEFWGVSAVVFDVRQSKRLFSVISSGDMPAKALGAILAALIHGDAQLPVLLGLSFVAYLGALFTLRATLSSHVVEATARAVRRVRRPPGRLVQQLFGGSELVQAMCLSLVAIAGVVTGVEYMFFLNVKHKFHASADVMQSVGWVLAATYGAATFFKLLVSRQALERYGVQWSLRLLPVVALVALAIFGGLQVAGGYSRAGQLAFFCGLYLLLEVLRRTVFDPVFLVLFQPLAPTQRLAAHTLAKGFYEPLGMGLTGLLFFVLGYLGRLDGGLPFAWMGALLLLALLALARTYRSYLAELKEGLGRRFAETAELALPDAARHVVLAQLRSPHPTEVLNAVAWLRQREPATLASHAPTLLEHADERVRLALLASAEAATLPVATLQALALRDPAPAVRAAAAQQLAAIAPDAPEVGLLLAGNDWDARQGAIRGSLSAAPQHAAAQSSLLQLLPGSNAPSTAIEVALRLLAFFPPDVQAQLVERGLASPDANIVRATLTALGTVGHLQLAEHLLTALNDKHLWEPAADSLVALGPAVVPLLREALRREPEPLHPQRTALVLERLNTGASRAALVELAQHPHLFTRGVALRSLRRFPARPADRAVFEHLLREEFALATHLLQGLVADGRSVFQATIDYELSLLHQRVFGLLAQLYDAESVATAQRNVAHAARERQANALEILDNLIPRPVYQGLQALLDDSPLAEKAALFARLTAPAQPARAHVLTPAGPAAVAGSATVAPPHPAAVAAPPAEPLPTLLLRRGHMAFTSWTLGLALRHWLPAEPDAADILRPYLTSPYQLLRESAQVAAATLAATQHQPISPLALPDMSQHSSHQPEARVSSLERVMILKSTALFAQTPENVLSSIVPIMKEVTFREGEEIFAQGDIGTSLFILHDGQVGIFTGTQQLATFGPGDFFGELALLDAEPRSATAAALSEVLAFRIDQEDFYDVMEERGEVLRNILRILCQRIRLQNEKMRGLTAG
ncbi:cyclic nucleotide-binding domain-containing protein [Hymenobacter sp. BT523]|uniref:cyclic nucleotide-binding domain-containing protein n=1 Tax=Hymenobacter sp. BT523 TaxID=2795725 RepID=UPI0018ECCB5C|nr:cyclic nucleotide-binding domain-containing protein [Hymenobacter sp. BT523]MBJ6109044.1 cyclic nucleotide-binding domain-containing protein [Hymenobacter sp. BT523]